MGTIAGKSFDEQLITHAYYCSVNADLDSGQTLDVLIRVGTLNINTEIGVAVQADYEVSIFENPTVTSPGTGQTIIDIKRSRKIEPPPGGTTIFSGPTLSSTGVLLIGPDFVPGGEDKGKGAGSFIVAPARADLTNGEDYLIRWENISGSTARITNTINFIPVP